MFYSLFYKYGSPEVSIHDSLEGTLNFNNYIDDYGEGFRIGFFDESRDKLFVFSNSGLSDIQESVKNMVKHIPNISLTSKVEIID